MDWQTRQSDRLHLIDELAGDNVDRYWDPGLTGIPSALIRIASGPVEVTSGLWLFTGRLQSWQDALSDGKNDVYVWLANGKGKPAASLVGKYVLAINLGWRREEKAVWILSSIPGGGLSVGKITHVTMVIGPPSRHVYTVTFLESQEEKEKVPVQMYRDDTLCYIPLPVGAYVFLQTWTDESGTERTSIVTPMEQISSVMPTCVEVCSG